MLNTNDNELFEICIDTLRSFPIEEGKKLILKHPQILERVNHVVATTENSLVKVIFQDFLSKMNQISSFLMRLRKKNLIGLMPFKSFCVIGLQIKKTTKRGSTSSYNFFIRK